MHADEVDGDRRRLGMSPRQQVLDKLYSYYRCDQYAARTVSWDGSKHVGMVERDTIALAGYVPPGFYVANSETLPIHFRRPTTPYHLCKVIVDRFTSLLFSQKRHPKITVAGDMKTEDFLQAVVEEGRLWPTMMAARAFGGACGTTVVGFKMLQGRPVFEVFDPRWATPKFLDRQQLVLQSLDYRYIFVQEVRDEKGNWYEVEWWYRRVIDTKSDTIFQPVMVDQPGDVQWIPGEKVDHNLGFCPVVWIQNMANTTDLDGDSDCVGIYELVEAIDRLNAQGEKGTLANSDPTTVVTTDAPMGEVKKGSGFALKLPAGSDAKYMEMTGSGIEQAKTKADDYKAMALEVAQCVLENPGQGIEKTATEVERSYASMLAKADILREQYGEMGVKRLLNMVLVAAKRLMTPRRDGDSIVVYSFTLPDKVVVNERTGAVVRTKRELGNGPYQVSLGWPPYFESSSKDATFAIQSAIAAKGSGLVDDLTAAKYVAQYFGVEDVRSMLEEVRRAARADQQSLEEMALKGPGDDTEDKDSTAPVEVQKSALNGAQVTSLLALAQAVAAGQITAESAMAIIEVSFPVNREEAFKIVGTLGGKKSFVAQTQAAAAKAKPPTPGAPAAPEAPAAPTPPPTPGAGGEQG
jgi:hypothetical protein